MHHQFRDGKINLVVTPSTPRPEGQGLLRVDPEPRFLTPSLKTGLGAAERVKKDEMAFILDALSSQGQRVNKIEPKMEYL